MLLYITGVLSDRYLHCGHYYRGRCKRQRSEDFAGLSEKDGLSTWSMFFEHNTTSSFRFIGFSFHI